MNISLLVIVGKEGGGGGGISPQKKNQIRSLEYLYHALLSLFVLGKAIIPALLSADYIVCRQLRTTGRQKSQEETLVSESIKDYLLKVS